MSTDWRLYLDERRRIWPQHNHGNRSRRLGGAVGVEILNITTGANGLVDVSVQHHWVTATGDTLTIDKANLYGVYVAPGLLAVVKYKVHIAGGTGQYQNTSGDINVIGEADFNAGHTALQFTGQLCHERDGQD
jgi:hypothetical protein